MAGLRDGTAWPASGGSVNPIKDGQSFQSMINPGEAANIIERERRLGSAHEALAGIQLLPITILPVDKKVVQAAADILLHGKREVFLEDEDEVSEDVR